LGFNDACLLFFRRDHGREDFLKSTQQGCNKQMSSVTHLNSFAIHDGAVHLENSHLDSAWRGEDSEANVDGVGSLRIKHRDLFLGAILFLRKQTSGVRCSNKKLL
jgi:hypothetical protein